MEAIMDNKLGLDNKEFIKPANWLDMSLRFASEYFEELCAMRNKYTKAEIQQSKKLTIMHRSLWTSLIAEIRKLFDNSRDYPNYSLRKIDFFKQNQYKSIVDTVYGEKIISRIIKTGNTFTLHLSKNKRDILSVSEICDSNLGELLNKLKKPIQDFTEFERKQNKRISQPL